MARVQGRSAYAKTWLAGAWITILFAQETKQRSGPL